jgi:nickel transport protein
MTCFKITKGGQRSCPFNNHPKFIELTKKANRKIMLKKLSWASLAMILSLVSYSPKILAHGSKIIYRQIEATEIIAQYDNGSPMAKAQVVIYAPDNPSQPWLKGITDEGGKFVFAPDYSLTGNWTVKVRVGGHGQMINIPIPLSQPQKDSTPTTLKKKETETETVITPLKVSPQTNPEQLTMLQKLMMAATGVWGFVGTALFFSRQKV